MKYKVGDLVTVCYHFIEYEGIIVQADDDDTSYYVFVYDHDAAYWYRETDLK